MLPRSARHAHHAVAEALHLELAHMAPPAFAFAVLVADQLLTLLLQPRLLRGVRRTRQHHERKHQGDYSHFDLHTLLRSLERDRGRLSPRQRHYECEDRHTAASFVGEAQAIRPSRLCAIDSSHMCEAVHPRGVSTIRGVTVMVKGLKFAVAAAILLGPFAY